MEVLEPKLSLSPTQSLCLQLLSLGRGNGLDGREVVASLLANRGLWYSCMPSDSSTEYGGIPLTLLRDLPDDDFNMDTLWVVATQGCEDDLQALVEESWEADEVEWVERKVFVGPVPQIGLKVLRVWWD